MKKGKFNLKSFVLGVVITIVIASLYVPAIAAFANQTITVQTGVNVFLDDQQLDLKDANGNVVQPFIYNGTTYLPVRAISNAFGKAITYDGPTQSVYIGAHDSATPAIMLYDMDYFSAGGGKFKKYSTVKDNLGNLYSNAIGGGYASYLTSEGTSWQEYLINGAYRSLEGRIILNYDYRTSVDNDDKRVVQIYCDDKLVYTSPVIEAGVMPVDFSIDLTGVIKLKIAIFDNYQIRLVNCGLYQ